MSELAFELTHARATDPFTSRLAAKSAAYKAEGQKGQLLDVFVSGRAMTGEKALRLAGLKAWPRSQRVSDLKRDGAIAVVDHAMNSNGVKVEVYQITEVGRAKHREAFQ